MKVPFFEFRDFPRGFKDELKDSLASVVDTGDFVLGYEVEAFEKRFADHIGVKYCVGVGNGFDAIRMCAMVLGMGYGDEVIVNANTIPVSLLALVSLGIIPVLAPFNNQTGQLEVSSVKNLVNKKTKAVMPVHLYHGGGDMFSLRDICDEMNLFLIEDFAHCHDNALDGKKLGSFGEVSATSFYPTKTIGALGDAGAVVTNDDALYKRLLKLRNYGKIGNGCYPEIGVNSRMDTLQANVLNLKMDYFEALKKERFRLYHNYEGAGLSMIKKDECECNVPHLMVARVGENVLIREKLQELGVGSSIHYPFDPNDAVWKECKWGNENLFKDVTRYSSSILSLPFFPGLTEPEQDYVIESLKKVM